MNTTSIVSILSTLSILFAALRYIFVIGSSLLQQKIEPNLSRYIALHISKCFIEGENISWDYLLHVCETESRSLENFEHYLTYQQVQEILATVTSFLEANFPSEIDGWKKMVRDIQKSIPIDLDGKLVVRGDVEPHVLKQVVLRINKCFADGEYISWDDLLYIYESESKSLESFKRSLTYRQVQEILLAVSSFLKANFPSEINRWDKVAKNIQKSIPIDQHGNLIIVKKGAATWATLSEAPKREAILLSPFGAIFAHETTSPNSHSKTTVWNNLVSVFFVTPVAIIIRIGTQLTSASTWGLVLLIAVLSVLTLIFCLRSISQYSSMVKFAFKIPRAAKELA